MSGDPQTVTVDLWNVGQGDASSLRLPSGELILIDVGPRNSTLSQWLRAAPRGVIRDIILTHNDADHAGALPEVVADPATEIRQVLMLEDRDRSDSRQRALFRPVIEYARRRGFRVGRLECHPSRLPVLWQDAAIGVTLRLRHPGFADNVQSRSSNDASAILTLDLHCSTLITWPGDARLARTAGVVRAPTHLLFGPHHGAPQDRGRGIMRQALQALRPAECFVSVGTGNGSNHPTPKYLSELAGNGCGINCTQMTLHCDRERVHKGVHVMNTSGYLGLPAPATGVFCRGHVRLTVSARGLEFDRYQEMHRECLAGDAARGRRLICLSRAEVAGWDSPQQTRSPMPWRQVDTSVSAPTPTGPRCRSTTGRDGKRCGLGMERIVVETDEIVRKFPFDGWQARPRGERLVQKELRRIRRSQAPAATAIRDTRSGG